jgi:hypothetical protein
LTRATQNRIPLAANILTGNDVKAGNSFDARRCVWRRNRLTNLPPAEQNKV